MNTDERLLNMPREERSKLCRDVMEQLSDYIDGDARAEFCRQVEEMLHGCQPFDAYCNTLRATIALAHECDEPPADLDDVYERSVEVVRRRLAEAAGASD